MIEKDYERLNLQPGDVVNLTVTVASPPEDGYLRIACVSDTDAFLNDTVNLVYNVDDITIVSRAPEVLRPGDIVASNFDETVWLLGEDEFRGAHGEDWRVYDDRARSYMFSSDNFTKIGTWE